MDPLVTFSLSLSPCPSETWFPSCGLLLLLCFAAHLATPVLALNRAEVRIEAKNYVYMMEEAVEADGQKGRAKGEELDEQGRRRISTCLFVQ